MKVLKEQEHRRQRVIPIDRKTLEMLEEYVERGGPVMRDGKGLIFGINRHRAWQIIKECAERAGLPKLVNTETGRVHNVSLTIDFYLTDGIISRQRKRGGQ